MGSVEYKVRPGKKITGRHRIYREGQKFPDTEAMGDMAHAVALGVVEVIENEPKKKRGRSKSGESKKDSDTKKDDDTTTTPPGGVQHKGDK